MTNYVSTLEQLHEVVAAYSAADAFAFDVETMGDHRLNPRLNVVFWVSLAMVGRADVIPIGHPTGNLVLPAEVVKAPKAVCPDRSRCTVCTDEIELTKTGKPVMRLINHRLTARFTQPPEQLPADVVWEHLAPIFDTGAVKIGHNIKFDVESVEKYLPRRVRGPYVCTQIMAVLDNENWGQDNYRLGKTIEREFEFVYDKSIGKAVEEAAFDDARLYSYLDAKFTWLVYLRLLPRLERQDLMEVFQLEMDVLEVVVDMEMTGCPIDVEGFEKLAKDLDFRLRQLEKIIEEANGGPINLNANRQVADLVYNVRGHKVSILTEKAKEPSTSEKALKPLAYRNPSAEELDDPKNIKDPIVAAILEWAQTAKIYSTYIVNNLANVQEFGRIYGEFDQMGARTGRFSSRSPNLQNIPIRRGKQVRDLFIAA